MKTQPLQHLITPKQERKRNIFFDKKKEFETYEKKLESDEMNELFKKYKDNHKNEDVDDRQVGIGLLKPCLVK